MLRRYYPDLAEVTRRLPHRTVPAIRTRAVVLGCTRPLKRWRTEQVDFVRANAASVTTQQLSSVLEGRTKTSVALKLSRLGLLPDSSTPRSEVVAVPLLQNIRDRAQSQDVSVGALGRLTGSARWLRPNGRVFSFRRAAQAVSFLGGELYIEWDNE